MDNLADLRSEIDAIDNELLTLLNRRAECAERVAEVKTRTSSDDNPVFYRPEREAQIFDRLRAANTGPLADDTVVGLFREVISSCRALELPLSVAYLGPTGTYTEAAAIKQFGQFARRRALASIDEVFREVESGSVHYGVVPVENSTEGMVNHTLDCFIGSNLSICAEIEMPIHHAFLLQTDASVEGLQKIVSHQQSLAQCRRWLDAHFPGIERMAVASNAEAARLVAEQPELGCVAGEMAADTYGLAVHARSIEDEPDNVTRFLVLGQQDVGPSGQDKSSLLVSARNESGALVKILEPFQRHNISLSRIETRPSKTGNWSYVFFIDCDGHHTETGLEAVLREVGEVAMDLRVLGSYPRAVRD
ncbi:MAG: prephenate dehydratase [Pseudomonadota bacterium]